MFDFGIEGYQPQWLNGRSAVTAVHRPRLQALVGRRLSHAWVMWDPDDDEWFVDGPVLFDFHGEQVEINHQKFDDLSITWNSITPTCQIIWPQFRLEWRHDALPELKALQNQMLRAVDLLEWTGEDIAHGMVALCFTFGSGCLTIYNALDENGLSCTEPEAGYRRHPLA